MAQATHLHWRGRTLALCRTLLRPLRGRGLQRFDLLARLYYRLYWRLATGRAVAEVQGSRMEIDLRQSDLARRLYMAGISDPAETRWLHGFLRPGMAVVDAGANIGYYALLAARLVGPGGRVDAFEPDPACYDLLRRNAELNGYAQLRAFPQALGGAPGTRWLSQPRNKTQQRLLQAAPDARGTRVEVTTLDRALADTDGRVDLVKMDVEGGEPEVLEGMRETLRRNPGLRILTEFNPPLLRAAGKLPEAYLGRLESCGFRLRSIRPDGEPLDAPPAAALLEDCGAEGYLNLLCEPAR